MNQRTAESLERARRDFARARTETDLHMKFKAYVSASINVMDGALHEPEEPRVKKAMKAILTGIGTGEDER